ncbi:thermonuclease family protein [Euryhalocaulis caribicus]|uniref:thermonuclease family protein n=1 Tax=Euryhalocaulis caribicus TaxID=1161401 RepID=UPI00039F41D3|nr:thermonuclease family protein [Euryhalocaulis caribicus]
MGLIALVIIGGLIAGSDIRVIDGDTFEVLSTGERVRIENIDTPEVGGRSECRAERQLAALATTYAESLFEGAAVEIERQGEDRYGRTLARVSVDGRDFGEEMIAGGYAVTWTGRTADWCGADVDL